MATQRRLLEAGQKWGMGGKAPGALGFAQTLAAGRAIGIVQQELGWDE